MSINKKPAIKEVVIEYEDGTVIKSEKALVFGEIENSEGFNLIATGVKERDVYAMLLTATYTAKELGILEEEFEELIEDN